MSESERNLWAPWRMEYIAGLSDDAAGCFLCRDRDAPDKDREHLVLWRSPRTLVLLNRFPYTGGHLLVAPTQHTADLEQLDRDSLQELTFRLRDAKRVLAAAVGAQGFNIGMNLGQCAGAGLPDHLHWHIVPRWSGDTNFMSVVGDARVIPVSLERVYERFLSVAREMGLPAE